MSGSSPSLPPKEHASRVIADPWDGPPITRRLRLVPAWHGTASKFGSSPYYRFFAIAANGGSIGRAVYVSVAILTSFLMVLTLRTVPSDMTGKRSLVWPMPEGK